MFACSKSVSFNMRYNVFVYMAVSDVRRITDTLALFPSQYSYNTILMCTREKGQYTPAITFIYVFVYIYIYTYIYVYIYTYIYMYNYI